MTYRIYYNREQDWPQIWSFDEGDQSTEVNVVDFRVEEGCLVQSGSAPQAQNIDRLASPTAWVEVEARSVSIVKGVAVFHL